LLLNWSERLDIIANNRVGPLTAKLGMERPNFQTGIRQMGFLVEEAFPHRLYNITSLKSISSSNDLTIVMSLRFGTESIVGRWTHI
jgi:hypothetical protein